MQIHWVHLGEIDPARRSEVEARLRALASERDDLVDVRLAGRHSDHHRQGDHEVRITCLARGRELVAARSREQASLALDAALDAFEREVRRMRDRRVDHRIGAPRVQTA